MSKEHLQEVNIATEQLLGKLWQQNYQANLPYITNGKGVVAIYDRFKGTPTLLVGAGPSLDKNIRNLLPAVGKSMIIACDTALRVMMENSIKPNILVNLDPQPKILYFLNDVDTRDITLVMPTTGSYQLREVWQGNILYYSQHAPNVPYLSQVAAAHKNMGLLTPGGTVLSIAFDLAMKIGANPIALAGQDLSYSGNKAYASGGHYHGYDTDSIFDIGMNHIVEKEDIFGRTVKTQKAMALTSSWFEWAIKQWNKDGKRSLTNCSEAGILTCMKQGTLAEFVSRNCTKRINVAWGIKKAMGR